jgi:hypothetical protein
MIRQWLVLSCFLVSCWLLQGCSSDTVFSGECKRDSDCEQYERCDTLDFRCVCDSDNACAHGEYCNASGSCQVISGCFTNDDCADGSFCDLATGECIGANSCRSDGHCDIGMICENNLCRLGCRATGDCDLGKREVCISGVCVQGKCENTGYCPLGLVCNLQNNECEQPAVNHCQAGCDPLCSDGVCPSVGDSPCGDPTAICAGMDVFSSHCWYGCDPEQDACPSGHVCKPTTFSWAVCADDGECANVRNTCGQASRRCALNQQVCASDADCHDFGAPTCLSGFCVIGYHCEPPSGCQD